MKKIISIAILSLFLTGCGLQKTDETKTTGKPNIVKETTQIKDESLEGLEKEINQTEIEDFDTDINTLDQDINQL